MRLVAGCSLVHLEGMSMREQFEVFSQSDIVIASYAAAAGITAFLSEVRLLSTPHDVHACTGIQGLGLRT